MAPGSRAGPPTRPIRISSRPAPANSIKVRTPWPERPILPITISPSWTRRSPRSKPSAPSPTCASITCRSPWRRTRTRSTPTTSSSAANRPCRSRTASAPAPPSDNAVYAEVVKRVVMHVHPAPSPHGLGRKMRYVGDRQRARSAQRRNCLAFLLEPEPATSFTTMYQALRRGAGRAVRDVDRHRRRPPSPPIRGEPSPVVHGTCPRRPRDQPRLDFLPFHNLWRCARERFRHPAW